MARALGLFSGGLDSMLAVCVLAEQGIELTGISFETPFFSAGRAKTAARQLGIPLIIRDITSPHLEMMSNPKHGFGSHMNPCIDCHILMVGIACGIMREEGFDFVFTGEVLNERPMSQGRQSLRIVEKESGCEGYLLRPLSARLLDETVAEREGKVDRGKLLSLHGRSRKPQMELARKYGLRDYPTPAGGCLLTDPGFSRRLAEMRECEGLDDVRNIRLLKLGRHFRIGGGCKVIVGRNEGENRRIRELTAESDAILTPRGVPGPTVLITGGADENDLLQAALLLARYSDAEVGETVRIAVKREGREKIIEVRCPANEEIVFKTV